MTASSTYWGSGATFFAVRQMAAAPVSKSTTYSGKVSLSATVTAPTKSTTPFRDSFILTDDGSGWCDVHFALVHNNTGTGATAGSGIYLFNLPSGYAFDQTVHLLSTGTATALNGNEYHYIIPNSDGYMCAPGGGPIVPIGVIPHSATQFKVVSKNTSIWGGSGSAVRVVANSGSFFIGTGTGISSGYIGQFRFKKA